MPLSRSTIVTTAALLALSAGPATAQAQPRAKANPKPVPAKPDGDKLLAQAKARAQHQAACRTAASGPQSVALGKAPDPAILQQVAPLRRPSTDGDALAPAPGPAFGTLYSGSSRAVTAADGTAMFLAVGRVWAPGTSVACMRLERREIQRRAARARGSVRRFLDREVTRLTQSIGAYGHDRILVFLASGAPAGSADAKGLAQGGGFTWAGSAADAQLTGVVPDGVATVTFTRAPGGPVDVPVHDNVVALHLTGSTSDVLGHMVWHDAAGAVLKTIG